MSKSLALVLATSTVAWAEHRGSMSMWSSTADTLVAYKSEGSACKFGDKEMGGLNAPTAQTPYIKSKKYCAVNRGMFGGGEICGACYRLTYHGDHESGLGHPGSEMIQVVDSGSWATFDCHMSAFHEITSEETGIFPITYERVPCETPGGPVAAVLHSDYYFAKLVFNNLRSPVKTADLFISDKKYPLKLVGGWWYVWTGHVSGKVLIKIVEEDGSHVDIENCFHWENRKSGSACSGTQHHQHQNLLLQSTAGNLSEVSTPMDNLTKAEATMPIFP